MKLNFLTNGLLLSLLLLFVLSIGTAKARTTPFLAHQEHIRDDELVKMDGKSHVNHFGETEGEETGWNPMGLEDCNDGDEECLKGRLLSEAHLDYIYTQQQHP